MFDLDPIALDLGVIQVRWYGILYLLAFLLGYWVLLSRRLQAIPSWTKEQVGDLIFYSALGVIFGGRLGYVLMYEPSLALSSPISLIEFWKPGRSFHGGAIGVLVCLWIFSIKYHLRFLQVTDFFAPIVPIGIAFGRIGNFINGELWGRVTDVPWAMTFSHVDNLPRHPSSLYEFLLEGIILYFIVDIVRRKSTMVGFVSGVFLIGYGSLRFVAELFREPDGHIGYLFNSLTMGQLLSIPMVLIGLALLYFASHIKRGRDQ